MLKNALLGTSGIILLSGSLLFLWFIILSGITDHTPVDKVYFLRADTSGITGARDVTQWTYFFFCGRDNEDCGKARAGPAFGKAWASNARNAPSDLIGSHADDTTSYHYYYMWRFGWVFILITLFFETLAWFAAFLACCGRLGAAISSIVAFVALFFHSLGTSLMTATFVQGRDAFHRDGRSARLGRYAFGFMWGSWAALFLASVLFCIGIRANKSRDSSGGKGYTGRRWRRNRSVRSRSYDGRRVKDEYAQGTNDPSPAAGGQVDGAAGSGETEVAADISAQSAKLPADTVSQNGAKKKKKEEEKAGTKGEVVQQNNTSNG